MSAGSTLATLGVGVVLVGGGVAAVAGLAELGYRFTQHYAPRYEEVRRETFEQSRAYQEGTLRDMDNLRLDWVAGSDVQKAAIRSVALHRLADVDPTVLTPDLRAWRLALLADPAPVAGAQP